MRRRGWEWGAVGVEGGGEGWGGGGGGAVNVTPVWQQGRWTAGEPEEHPKPPEERSLA